MGMASIQTQHNKRDVISNHQWPVSWLFTRTVSSGTDQRKHQNSTSLAFVRGIHWWPVNSPHKGPVMRKMFPLDDVIMHTQIFRNLCCITSISAVNHDFDIEHRAWQVYWHKLLLVMGADIVNVISLLSGSCKLMCNIHITVYLHAYPLIYAYVILLKLYPLLTIDMLNLSEGI